MCFKTQDYNLCKAYDDVSFYLKASSILCQVHRRHVVRKYVRGLNPERKRQLEMKFLSQQIFKGNSTWMSEKSEFSDENGRHSTLFSFLGKKASYDASVRNYFVDTRMENELQNRMDPVRNNLKNTGQKLIVSVTFFSNVHESWKDEFNSLILYSMPLPLPSTIEMDTNLAKGFWSSPIPA